MKPLMLQAMWEIAKVKSVVKAGGDVTLAGSQVKGKGVELDAENLKIESLQDKSSYRGKQMNASASVTVGYGFCCGW